MTIVKTVSQWTVVNSTFPFDLMHELKSFRKFLSASGRRMICHISYQFYNICLANKLGTICDLQVCTQQVSELHLHLQWNVMVKKNLESTIFFQGCVLEYVIVLCVCVTVYIFIWHLNREYARGTLSKESHSVLVLEVPCVHSHFLFKVIISVTWGHISKGNLGAAVPVVRKQISSCLHPSYLFPPWHDKHKSVFGWNLILIFQTPPGHRSSPLALWTSGVSLHAETLRSIITQCCRGPLVCVHSTAAIRWRDLTFPPVQGRSSVNPNLDSTHTLSNLSI